MPATRKSSWVETMKLAVPDMISNSYFPRGRGGRARILRAGRARRRARVDLSGRQGLRGTARRCGRFRRRIGAFGAGGLPEMAGRQAPLRASAGHVLVPGDARGFRCPARRHRCRQGRRIGAAPWVEMGLRGCSSRPASIRHARASPSRRCRARSAPASISASPPRKALEERKIDGFWANGMGAEVAVRRGVGTIVLDIRRGDGPKACFNYTMASLAAADRLIELARMQLPPPSAPSSGRTLLCAKTSVSRQRSVASSSPLRKPN